MKEAIDSPLTKKMWCCRNQRSDEGLHTLLVKKNQHAKTAVKAESKQGKCPWSAAPVKACWGH